MPAEGRDRLFENALARHLRADAAAADHSACLDTKLLAALHGRMLSPEEMIVAKNHRVSCARCQEILVQLEATQNLQDAQNNEAELVVPRASSSSKSGAVVEQAASAPASVPIIQKPLDKITPFHARKSLLLRWAAPAGAIAAGLLLWIGVREFRRPPKFEGKPTEIAQNRAQSSQ